MSHIDPKEIRRAQLITAIDSHRKGAEKLRKHLLQNENAIEKHMAELRTLDET